MKTIRGKLFSPISLLSLVAGLILGGSSVAFLATNRTASTAAPTAAPTAVLAVPPATSIAAPTAVRVDVLRLRPYTDTSPWNTPIDSNPIYDRYSDQMVATLGLKARGQIGADSGNYSYTVYFVDEATPRWDIPCTRYKCTIASEGESRRTEMLTDVPIPPEAKPSSGTDMQMIVIDTTTFAEYNLWGLERTASGWSMRNGSIYNIRRDGTPVNYGSRGAGVPYFAGLVRRWEVEQGHIDHAIAFSYPYPADKRCVFPASKTDGNSSLPYAIPEGARLQLDPSLTDADFDAMGLNSTGKIIARALQKYGMILVNYAGHPKISVENLADNPFATGQWSDPPYEMTNKTIANIPYTSFRVLALPDAYWNPELQGPTHGKCHAYPTTAATPAQ
jgi:hypothetical protein